MLNNQARNRKKTEDYTPVGSKRKKKDELNRIRAQDVLFSPDYILKKVFRKDGPPLGVHFDELPSHAFSLCKKGARKSHRACQENQRLLKRRKISKPTIPILDYDICNQRSSTVKKHGIGKGLMTLWRVTNPKAGQFPTGVDSFESANIRLPTKPPVQAKKKRIRRPQPVMRKLQNKLKEKKLPIKSRKVECRKNEKPKQMYREKCELALEEGAHEEDLDRFSMLLDDEELEIRELQSGPNPLTCSAHFVTSGLYGCSLCKDMLTKFPPNSVAMKQPLHMQPWDSSPDLVKKLFKVFHFLCTYAGTIDICSFTFDDFAQAFHEKDSFILGKVNVALLKLLLSDLEAEISTGILSHLSKNEKFIGLLHSIEHQDLVLKFWRGSLNSLTWIEILRQVLGFGSKHGISPREALKKESNLMVKYGLRPGNLKGELFTILSSQGNNGLKVSDLAKSSSIVELNLAATTGELELLISSTLSSDITLFEKISASAYRLRIDSVMKDTENDESESQDCGSVDNEAEDSGKCSSSDDSDCDSRSSTSSEINRRKHGSSKDNVLTVYTEIDESHPGEVWLLGLMEGEYSELNIEEKLNALVALIDLLSAGPSIRMEDPIKSLEDCVPNMNHAGSGAKIKRSTARQQNLPSAFGGYTGPMLRINEVATTRSVLQPMDSSVIISKLCGKENPTGNIKDAKEMEIEEDLHFMQSIFLGSDRRYNRYWLFLGPCNAYDPGHKRIYFESSEDGHWEVIHTEEALCILMSALDRRGTREAQLLSSLEKREEILCRAMSSLLDDAGNRQSQNISREDSSSAVSDVDNRCLSEIQNDLPASIGAIALQTTGTKGEQQKMKWSRIQAFDMWTWKSFYSDLNCVKYGKRSYIDSLARCELCHDLYWRDEKHCKICHTTFELDFDLEEKYAVHVATCRESSGTDVFPKHKVLPSQLQSLKAAVYAIESVIPAEALVGAWMKSAHNLWVKRLRRTSNLAEFLQVLADFVAAINEDWLQQHNDLSEPNVVMEEVIGSFPNIPQTTSAVALWVVKLDALIAPHLEKVHAEKEKEPRTRFRGKRVPCQ